MFVLLYDWNTVRVFYPLFFWKLLGVFVITCTYMIQLLTISQIQVTCDERFIDNIKGILGSIWQLTDGRAVDWYRCKNRWITRASRRVSLMIVLAQTAFWCAACGDANNPTTQKQLLVGAIILKRQIKIYIIGLLRKNPEIIPDPLFN